MEIVVRAVIIGLGATLFLDVWAAFLKRAFGVSGLDYAMLGRWIGHMRTGIFVHKDIRAAQAVGSERVIGWAAHYAIGVMFAAALLGACGDAWARQPMLIPALATGILTVGAPFFVMQPCMGMGIAASRALKPGVARLRSLVSHLVFGLGLYLTSALVAQLTH